MPDDLQATYRVPDELIRLLSEGFLEVLSTDEEQKTVEFHVPSRRITDTKGRVTSYSVIWIHPEHNVERCHFYSETPGDQPNFYVRVDTTDLGEEIVDGLESVEDLMSWLEELRSADIYR